MQSIPLKQLPIFATLVLLSIAIALGPGRHLASFAYHTGDQSYILLVPALCAMLIYRDQDRIFRNASSGLAPGAIAGFITGVGLIAAGYMLPAGSEVQMVVTALGLIAFWTGAFIYCFGRSAARAALFPIAMLLWIIPIPQLCIDAFTRFLQVWSTELVAVLFQMTGTAFLRDGFIFQLSTQSIEVAKECSGIRSSLCLILLTLIIAHESLRGNWRRAVLVIATIPLVILKNGIRIVTLTLLAIHVDPSFLTGPLHHRGGIVFFLIGMAMLIPLLALLRRGDEEPSAVRSLESAATAR